MATIDVSIVICTCNRANMLRAALESLICQETDGAFRYEVVVVDNASTDDTAAVIQSVSRRAAVAVRAVHEPRRGQVYARNRGLSEAHGTWIANFDDDQIAEASWLKELMALAEETGARSVGGALRLLLPAGCDRDLSPLVRRVLGESVDWHTARPYTRKQGPGSGNQMLHRSVFDKVGGYDCSYGLRGYDTDLYRRIRDANIVSWFTPRAVAHHVTPAARLEQRYFQETCLHNGWSFARRDLAEWGRMVPALVAVARLGQAACLNVPRFLWARLRRNQEDELDARCRLWRAEGYARSALYWTAPRLFKQQGFFSRYEFRAEHKMLAADSS
jgi:glycosyltransferase involved in cell wall biosynthesis